MTYVCYSTTARPSKHVAQMRMVFLVLFCLILYVPWIYILLVVTHRELGSRNFFSWKTFFQFQLFLPCLRSIRTFSAVDVHSDVPKPPTYLLAIRGECIQSNSSVLPGCGKLHPYTSQIRSSFTPLGTVTNTYTTALLPTAR